MNPDVLLNRIRLEQRGLIDIHKKLYEMEHLLPVPDPMQFAKTAESAALLSEKSTAHLRNMFFSVSNEPPIYYYPKAAEAQDIRVWASDNYLRVLLPALLPDKKKRDGCKFLLLPLGCTDQLTAEYVSQRTGIASVAVSSTSKSLSTLRVSDYTPQYRESSGVGKRPVLTPDEVLRLPVDEALVILRGHKVLKVHKMDYPLHPAYKQLRECKASAHIPEWRKALPETLETPPVETKASPKAPPKRRGRPAKSKAVVATDKESIITKPETEKEISHGNEQ